MISRCRRAPQIRKPGLGRGFWGGLPWNRQDRGSFDCPSRDALVPAHRTGNSSARSGLQAPLQGHGSEMLRDPDNTPGP